MPQLNSHVSKNIPFIRQKYAITCIVFVLISIVVAMWNYLEFGFAMVDIVSPAISILFALYAWRDQGTG